MSINWNDFENEYKRRRPIEPSVDDEYPEMWSELAHYAEEYIEKAFEAGFEFAMLRFKEKIQETCDDVEVNFRYWHR